MLKAEGVEFEYREYTKEPLSVAELRTLLKKLGMKAGEVLRSREAKKVGLSADDSQKKLLAAIAENPKLLTRPIGVRGKRAVVGRPPENLLELVS